MDIVCDVCGAYENVRDYGYTLEGVGYVKRLCPAHSIEQLSDPCILPLLQSYTGVKDSGVREEFDTGSKRDTQTGKGRYDLLPFLALDRLAKHYEHGAIKYGDHNWRKGQPLSRYLSSTLRHITKWAMGFRDEDHLAAALWNIAAIIETEAMIDLGRLPQELDDLWRY